MLPLKFNSSDPYHIGSILHACVLKNKNAKNFEVPHPRKLLLSKFSRYTVCTVVNLNFEKVLHYSITDTSEWSVPPQTGFPISGRMGHASVYDAGTGLIYVEGGVVFNEDDKEIASQLLVYNPMTHLWSILSAR